MLKKTTSKRIICLLLISVMLFSLAACGKGQKLEGFKASFYDSFDTVISLSAYCESEDSFREMLDEVHDEYLRYHQLFDIYDNYEGLNNAKTINDNAGKAPVKVDREMIDLLLLSKNLYAQTEGNVNIAFGAVLKLWHEARESADSGKPYLPDEDELRSANLHTSIDDVIIDEQNSTVYLKDECMSIDLGAIAKGFATECIIKKLMDEGHDHVLISAGGNTRCIGKKPDGADWVIAIENPVKTEDSVYVDILGVSDMSVVTSGTYERFFDYDGQRYHHIINKDSLRPENEFLSVSIVTQDSGAADALSTAVFNMPLKKGLEYIDKLDGVEAMWILADESIECSKGFADYRLKQ